MATRPVLTAQWKNLVIANYAVDPAALAPLAPPGTRVDLWDGAALMSLVAFQFHDTRLFGVPIPLHRDFEEVNLRCYVRRETGGESRRGVVFIREIVPRLGVALAARFLYGEAYAAMPVRSVLNIEGVAHGESGHLHYSWGSFGRRVSLSASVGGPPALPAMGSLEQFITEHYWGYNRRGAAAREYRVEHPSWRVWHARSVSLDGDVVRMYGKSLGSALTGAPHSAFVAEGSAVAVFAGKRI